MVILLMNQYVAVDSSTPHGGTEFFIVGVAVEVEDKAEFREYYFNQISQFLNRHDITRPFNVIKSKNIVNRVPSYQIRESMSDLVETLIKNPGLSRINISVGWYNEDVDLEYNDKDPMNGNSFAANFLKQYFNVATLWQYHHSHEYGLPEKALIDDVNGKITGAWQYVGNEFDLDIVPSGDITYPSISTADILAYNIQGLLGGHQSTKFTEYPDIAESYLIDQRGEEENVYIKGDYVNESHTDQIVPTLPYPIKSEVHYPHPILFVYDDVIGDSEMLPKTDFHAYCRKWALQNEGVVVTWPEDKMPAIVYEDDVVVYTGGTSAERIKLLRELNPTRQFTVRESGELLNDMQE